MVSPRRIIFSQITCIWFVTTFLPNFSLLYPHPLLEYNVWLSPTYTFLYTMITQPIHNDNYVHYIVNQFMLSDIHFRLFICNSMHIFINFILRDQTILIHIYYNFHFSVSCAHNIQYLWFFHSFCLLIQALCISYIPTLTFSFAVVFTILAIKIDLNCHLGFDQSHHSHNDFCKRNAGYRSSLTHASYTIPN